MNCHEFHEALSDQIERIDSELPPGLRKHAGDCQACGQFLREQQMLSAQIARWSHRAGEAQHADEAVLTDRILAAWHSEQLSASLNSASLNSAADETTLPPTQPVTPPHAARPNQVPTGSRRQGGILAVVSTAIVVTAIVIPQILENRSVEQTVTQSEPVFERPGREDPEPILPELLEGTEQAYRVLAQRAAVSLTEVAQLPLPARPAATERTAAASATAAQTARPEPGAEERQYGSRIRKAVGFLFELVPDETTTL